MEVPENLYGRVSELIGIEVDGANKRRLWAVVLGLTPYADGDQWCVLWGENIQSGIAGFGDTPAAATEAFERAMYQKRISSQ